MTVLLWREVTTVPLKAADIAIIWARRDNLRR